jgi:hypothetical protein
MLGPRPRLPCPRHGYPGYKPGALVTNLGSLSIYVSDHISQECTGCPRSRLGSWPSSRRMALAAACKFNNKEVFAGFSSPRGFPRINVVSLVNVYFSVILFLCCSYLLKCKEL